MKRAPLVVIALSATACAARQEAVAFSERPELRAEPVRGCGGGALRYLVPEEALPALHEAATRELEGEAPFDVESERIPCQPCDAHGGVCGYVVVRYREPPDGRAGLRLRFRSTVVQAKSAWSVLDSERVLDEARLTSGVSYDDARAALDWARAHLGRAGPIDAVASAKAMYEADAPRGAELRLSQVVRVGEGEVLFRYVYLRRSDGGFTVVGERRDSVSGPLPPPVRGDDGTAPSPFDVERSW